MIGKLTTKYNGKDYTLSVELSEEQIARLREIANVDPDITGWEAPQVGQMGFYEDEFNKVVGFEITEENLDFANELYEKDNFFSTEEAAKNTVRADNVLRKLRHYAITHRKTDTHMAEGGYDIIYDYESGCLELGATGSWLAAGDIVFETEAAARGAMSKYADDLEWYFTKGKVRM